MLGKKKVIIFMHFDLCCSEYLQLTQFLNEHDHWSRVVRAFLLEKKANFLQEKR